MATEKGDFLKGKANLIKVAEHAGVSAMTVSRVINQPSKVADATRQRVEAALDALGYVPNLAANTLRRKRSGVIVAMVPTIDNSVFSDTIQGISDALETAGYQLLLGCTSYSLEKEEKLTRAFLGRRPDGVILTGSLHTDVTRNLLSNAGIPVVEMWDIAEGHIDMAVGFDNFQAGYDIATYMLGRGYKNIGYVAGTEDHEAHENRAAKRSAGIYAAFEDACLPPPVRKNVDDPLNIECCGAKAADLVASHKEIDALICANEIIGVGAIKALQLGGLVVPDDVSVAGIGDASIAGLIHPGLTTIRILGNRIGQRSAEVILECLKDGSAAKHQEDIGFHLVVRGSTK
ncbi:LacI family DNA-binding transcriptional regulator [Ruegeria hyattellae]|uniref:LacI family DNA-binding transcriptional regulator n=1 Tax=Ruegeria hyattellae TaxID=3233337 RepID=UPI00355C912D